MAHSFLLNAEKKQTKTKVSLSHHKPFLEYGKMSINKRLGQT